MNLRHVVIENTIQKVHKNQCDWLWIDWIEFKLSLSSIENQNQKSKKIWNK